MALLPESLQVLDQELVILVVALEEVTGAMGAKVSQNQLLVKPMEPSLIPQLLVKMVDILPSHTWADLVEAACI